MGSRLDAVTRQRLIAEAVVRLLARAGFEGTTVRTVAAEAGVSAGAVQKQFATKDELLLAGCRLVAAGYAERNAVSPTGGGPREWVRGLLLDALPLDEQRRTESLVWSALTDRAGRSPEVADVVRTVDAHAHTELTRLLTEAHLDDPPGAATLLIAVCDGLATRLTYDPSERDTAVAVLDTALDAVWAR